MDKWPIEEEHMQQRVRQSRRLKLAIAALKAIVDTAEAHSTYCEIDVCCVHCSVGTPMKVMAERALRMEE